MSATEITKADEAQCKWHDCERTGCDPLFDSHHKQKPCTCDGVPHPTAKMSAKEFDLVRADKEK